MKLAIAVAGAFMQLTKHIVKTAEVQDFVDLPWNVFGKSNWKYQKSIFANWKDHLCSTDADKVPI